MESFAIMSTYDKVKGLFLSLYDMVNISSAKKHLYLNGINMTLHMFLLIPVNSHGTFPLLNIPQNVQPYLQH
jgi:hypothetical protein